MAQSKYTYENCLEKALLYNNKKDFRENYYLFYKIYTVLL